MGGSYAKPGSIDAKFGETESEWDFGNAYGAKIQMGYDFGEYRADVKLRAFKGSVDEISGTNNDISEDDAYFAFAMVNA